MPFWKLHALLRGDFSPHKLQMEVLWLKPQAVSNMSPLQMIVSQCCFWKMQASRSSAVWDQDELQGDVSNSPTAPNSVERVADSPVTCPLHPGGVQQTSYKLHMQLNQFTLLVSCSVLSSIFSDKQQQNLSLSLSLYLYLSISYLLSLFLSIYVIPFDIHLFCMLRILDNVGFEIACIDERRIFVSSLGRDDGSSCTYSWQ